MTEHSEEHAMTAAGDEQRIEERLGAELRQAREQSGRSLREIATELRLTATAVRYIEAGDWDQLGAPVYGRGYVRAYGRMLDVDTTEADNLFDERERKTGQEALAIVSSAKRNSALQRYQRLASYVIATALLAIPAVVWVTRAFEGDLFVRQDNVQPAIEEHTLKPVTETNSTRPDEPPMLASMTGLSPRSKTTQPAEEAGEQAAGDPAPDDLGPSETSAAMAVAVADEQSTPVEPESPRTLKLELMEEAWLDVRDASGERLALGLKPAGSIHVFPLAAGVRVRLGNADAVVAHLDGQAFDLAPHMNRDVAEFELSNDSVQ